MRDFSKDISIKKPTVALREAKVGLHKAVGKNVPADTRRGYTDRMEALSGSVMIGYKNRPSTAQMAAIVNGCNLAARIIRKANDEFAAICFLRRSESPLMMQVLAKHFGLVAGDTAGGMLKDNIVDKKISARAVFQKDRRWVIEQIRKNMLSLSFHLNTGIYLIDADNTRRDIRVGDFTDPTQADPNEEAYVGFIKKSHDKTTWRANDWKQGVDNFTCGFRKGEMHVDFANLENYSAISFARVVIHEATHKYFNTNDEAYAHEDTYGALSLAQCLKNADSYAWAAVSLYSGSLKMASPAANVPDWAQCTKP
jgi:hypothetical protein